MPPLIDRDAPESAENGARPGKGLAELAYDALAGMMARGELPPGEPIQEAPLARSLGISRTPLREALGRLEGEMLLQRDAARRLVVRRFTIEDVLETVHLRRILERETTRLATERIEAATLDALQARILALLADAEAPVADERTLDAALHGAIAVASGSTLMAELLAAQQRRMELFRIRHIPGRREASCREHLALLGALRARDATRAVQAMEQHLEGVRQRLIDALTRGGRAW